VGPEPEHFDVCSAFRQHGLACVVRFCRATVAGRLPLLRRLLTVGGFLVCGWLLGGIQAAHAADGPSPPLPAVTEGVTGGVADSVKTAVRDLTAPAGRVTEAGKRGAAPPRSGPSDADVLDAGVPEVDVSEVVGEAVAPPARAARRPPADKQVSPTARTGTDRRAGAVSSGTAQDAQEDDAAPDRAVRGVADGVLGSVTSAVSAVTAEADAVVRNAGVAAPLPEAGVTGPAGLVGSAVSGPTSPAITTVGSVADTLNRPLGALTAPLTAPLSPLTAPLGTLTAPLGPLTAPLGPLTAPLATLTAPLATLTAPLATLTAPLGTLTAPIGPLTAPLGSITAPVAELAAPVTAPPAMLVTGVTAGVVSGIIAPPPGYETRAESLYRAPTRASPGLTGPVSAGLCRVIDVVGQCADIMSPPIVMCFVRAVDGVRTRPRDASCPVLGWSPSEHVSESSFAGRYGAADGKPAPAKPRGPFSGDPSHALPKSWHGDGAGDPARAWEARVIATFVPAWFVAPPAISTAADEPAYSPD
jgi:hypothetical protein